MRPLLRRTYIEKEYKYHCLRCKYWEWAPADVVDEFADMDDFCKEEYSKEDNSKRMGMPIMVCPSCDADLYYAGEKKEEEHSCLETDDDCTPF